MNAQEVNELKNRWSSSLLWAIVALVLLLSILQPIQVLTMSFMAVPFVMLYATQSRQGFALITAAVLAIVYVLMGKAGIYVAVSALYFIIPGIVIGQMFKGRKPALSVFVAGTVTFLIESLVLFVVAKWVLDFNVYEFVIEMLNYGMVGVEQSALFPTQVTAEMKQQFALLMSKMVPFMMIVSALYMGTITYAISRRLLTAQGHDVQKMKPVHQWMLPKSLVVYYFIVVILDFVGPKSTDSFLTMILLNLAPLLQLAFVVQGIAFLFFFAHMRKWGKLLPIVITIAALFIPLLYSLLRIVGLVDLVLPLRKFMSKPKV
ncbi:DUF2232 domain-containing protein [Paenibacillus sp.]|uniref:DUF2232 domain-containing protein n=1 Tax=Paenibacillus sp. TaxID=58172 RepID=UPI003463A1D0